MAGGGTDFDTTAWVTQKATRDSTAILKSGKPRIVKTTPTANNGKTNKHGTYN